jgi:glycosyltransferase involved in cell wall biosynthesis
MWRPSVSVVMCTYNGEQFIREQINSILAQTYPISEFLIFDDGSVDKTAAIIKSYVEAYPFIKFCQNKTNLGYNFNFQQALLAATSEVIAIADQDDYWHPQKIEKMIGAWDKSMPIIYCDSQRFEENIPAKFYSKRLNIRFKGDDSGKLFFFNSVSGHAMLLQRSFLSKVLPFEKDLYYDWWVAFVASFNGGVDFINETLVYQRVHESNVSIDNITNEKQKFLNYREVVKMHLKKFVTAPNLKAADKRLGELLYERLVNLNSFYNRLQFFLLILQYRKILFYYKRRVIGLFSHVKHAFFWAFK